MDKYSFDELHKLGDEATKRGDHLMAASFYAMAGVVNFGLQHEWAAMLEAFVMLQEHKGGSNEPANPNPVISV